MRPNGDILITRVTWEMLDRPDHAMVLFNRVTETIGIKPIRSNVRNAYPVEPHGRCGGRVIRAASLVRQFRIRYEKPIRFHGAEIDDEGMLLLELSTAAPTHHGRRIGAFHRERRVKIE